MVDLFNSIMAPIEWLVATIMYGFHAVLTELGMPEASGWTWTLSIVGLVLVMRAAMIPLFVRQINASRKLQMIQPEIQKIQKKYKGKSDPESRQAMTQETMELYKKEGTNPFSSCLPILVQSPFFFGLFRVLNGLDEMASGQREAIGPLSRELAAQAESADIFGAQLSDTFMGTFDAGFPGNSIWQVRVVTVVLVILMSATTFLTQRQLMTKNMPQSALDSPFAKQQKMLLYVFPIIFAVSGVNFPIGVLIYWFTTNVWSMTQQFYVIRRMPAPGSAAEKAYHERLRRKGKPVPGEAEKAEAEAEEAARPTGQRVQPKSKKRAKNSAAKPAATGDAPAAEAVASDEPSSGATTAADDASAAGGGSANGTRPAATGTNGSGPGRQTPKKKSKKQNQRSRR
ncbi:membrane protein insertase YidC [Phycicoccus sp. BSK3Z-2]|uniref:Membrane protein insertase YidC n=1 Tax=Phycicoccus avicenniae TaxID=2828860 RepID=A0A941D5N8_9MICO|nr:membrane protein insertase YidC [Phycicoccus avicenniae]MBR7742584.1 membrane protein insertase YidC [Phycicoccus avicenniae]